MQFQPSQYSTLGQSTLPDGFVYDSDGFVVPISAPASETGLALGGVGVGLGLGLGLVGLILVGPLVITPWIVKAFKPEWSYGRRVAAGFGVSAVLGAISQIGRSK